MSAARKVGIGFLGLLVLLVALLGVVFLVSNSRLTRTFDDVGGVDIVVASDSASVARGQYLGEAILACSECHGKDLGGAMFINAAPMGRIAAPNLTRGRGGVAGEYTGRDRTGRFVTVSGPTGGGSSSCRPSPTPTSPTES